MKNIFGYEPLTATNAYLCYTLAGMQLVLYSVSATESKMLWKSNWEWQAYLFLSIAQSCLFPCQNGTVTNRHAL